MKKCFLVYWAFLVSNVGLAQWSTNGTNVYYNGGSIGIGTSTPVNLLEINATNLADGIRLDYGNAGYVALRSPSIQGTWWNPITVTSDAGLIYGGTTLDSVNFGFVIAPWASTMEGLRLDRYGNVGINTNNTKGYQLAVNGSAIFTKVVVKPYGSWPDFVFRKDYNLPDLNELEKYLVEHQHLPGIPAAEEISRDGIDLGGQQMVSLQKIEELTLYLIRENKVLTQQNRQLNEQHALLERQQKEIDELKAMIQANHKQ